MTTFETKKFAKESLGSIVELKNGKRVLHIENDLPIIRVFDFSSHKILCINIKDVKKIINKIVE